MIIGRLDNRGVVRGQWLATRGGKPRRSATGTTGDGSNTVTLSRDYRYPCNKHRHVRVCAP
jgi:hypothetical protein